MATVYVIIKVKLEEGQDHDTIGDGSYSITDEDGKEFETEMLEIVDKFPICG